MKTSARFLAMLLAVVMIASAALSVSAFSDVNSSVEHSTAIGVLSQLGVIGGYEDGTFKPTQNVTRAEMAKLVYVLYNTFKDAVAGASEFKDVASDNWASGYIAWCANKDIIGGYGDGNFGPNDNVTYDQALKMVCGILGYTDFQLWPYDVRAKALRDLDLGAGIPESVQGSDMLTRAQVAQIMYNALTVDMNEKKTVDKEITSGFTIPVEVAKTLAVDFWKYNECVYTISSVDNTNDKVTIAIVSFNGETTIPSGAEYPAAGLYEIAELGLEAYEGKLNDLKGLNITLLARGDDILAKATVNGTILDNVAITYAKDEKSITVNGETFTAKNFEVDAKRTFTAEYDTDSSADDVFSGDKIASALKAVLDDEFVARVVDADGDGEFETLTIVPKTAYEVTSITTKSGVKYVNYKELDGSPAAQIELAKATVALAKGDVFVGAKLGETLYAEIVKPVETYPTKISTKTVTLKEGGAVATDAAGVKVAGTTAPFSISNNDLIDQTVAAYWIYNGQLIKTDAAAGSGKYNIAILQEVKQDANANVDESTMTSGAATKAVLIIDGVKTEVVLATTGHKVGGAAKTASELLATYAQTTNTSDNDRVIYTYAIVADYTEDDGVYTLTINEDIDASETEYVVAPAGATISYSASTGLYTVANGSTVVSNKVVLDENSAIYYQYTKPTTGTFKHLGKYTKDTITAKSFANEVTAGETYLVYDENTKLHTLIATLMVGEIEGAATDVVSYDNDGRLILFAPEASSIEPVDGKLYYSHIFMDNKTLTNAEAVINKEVEQASANATEAGHLYGWDPLAEVYVEINANTIKGADTLAGTDDDIKTVAAHVITDVITARNLVTGADFTQAVTSAVTIWGLDNKAGDAYSYKQFDIDELAMMVDMVNDKKAALAEEIADMEAGEAKTAKENELAAIGDINALFFFYEDANDDLVLSTIVVEIFEADSEDVVTAVNSEIFTNFAA